MRALDEKVVLPGVPDNVTHHRTRYNITSAQRRAIRKMLDDDLQIVLVRGVYAFAWYSDDNEIVASVGPQRVILLYTYGMLDRVESYLGGAVEVFALSSAGMKEAAKRPKIKKDQNT